jgi:hypothetical protein
MRALPALALALTAIALACAPEPTAPGRDELSLIAGVTVKPGSLLSFEYQNESHVSFGVNECGVQLETQRSSGDGWEPVPEEPRICPAALRIINHGQRVLFRFEVPTDTPDGTYRFMLRAYAVSAAIPPGTLDIVSESFRVRR